jgi:hypothetical protein
MGLLGDHELVSSQCRDFAGEPIEPNHVSVLVLLQ